MKNELNNKKDKVMKKQFIVFYKKQSKREQVSPDMRGIDHTLYKMVVDAKTMSSAKRMVSKMDCVKFVCITETGTRFPIFKIVV